MTEWDATVVSDTATPCSGPMAAPNVPWHTYRVYGLTVASQLELPELEPVPGPVAADVEIRCAALPAVLEGATRYGSWLQVAPEACQMRIEGIASFRIDRGRSIVVDRRILGTSGSWHNDGDVRLFLLGSAFGALLHQRSWLPLHCSAVQTPSGVWAFTGPSKAGKSTTAAHLHFRQGWPLVCDDVAVIKHEDSAPLLHPGPPRLKLWKDALESLQIEPTGLTRDFTPSEKYHLRMDVEGADPPPVMRALVILDRSDDGQPARIERIHGIGAFEAIMGSLYRPEVGRLLQRPGSLMLRCARLANQIEVYRFRRPWANDALSRSLEPLIQLLGDHR